MSAERLREAADRLDALAEAIPTDWRQWVAHPATHGDPTDGPTIMRVSRADDWTYHGSVAETDYSREGGALAAYIATMHPGVGKALAAWLRLVGRLLSEGFSPNAETHAALAVADAILGGAS